MPTTSTKLPPIPAPDVARVDAKGRPVPVWYEWDKAVERIVRRLQEEIP